MSTEPSPPSATKSPRQATIHLLNSGQPLEQSQGSHRPCSRATLPRKTPTGLEEAPSQLQVLSKAASSHGVRGASGCPRNTSSRTGGPSGRQGPRQLHWQVGPRPGGTFTQAWHGRSWSSKSPFQPGSEKEPRRVGCLSNTTDA